MINLTSVLGLASLASLASQIPWTFIFLITQLFGVRLYSLKNKEDCKRIQKRINKWSSHIADGGKGFGYSIGYWYLMSISIENSDLGDKYSVWLIATASSYEALIKHGKDEDVTAKNANDDEDAATKKTALTIYVRTGSYFNPYYKKHEISIARMTPRPDQEYVLKTVREHQEKHDHTVVYLYGPPGKGKSLVGILLANSYKGSYCNSLKPWQPGDTISSLYADVEPTKECPLILVFDEFDTALLRIHAGIEPHKNLPIHVSDKTGWNQMLDEIQLGIYPHLILLITSNKDPEFIKSLDPSYIREGRVDLCMELE